MSPDARANGCEWNTGSCYRASEDYPGMQEWLVDQGVDSDGSDSDDY
jgi:hypothetical protein